MLVAPVLLPPVVMLALQDRIGGSDCERIAQGWFAQPVNTISSCFYVVAGLVVLARNLGKARERGGEVIAYSALLMLIGFGSVIYHGPQPTGAKLLHDWPIPILIVLILVTPILRRRRGRDPLPGLTPQRIIALAVTGALAGLAYLTGRTSSPLCDPDSLFQPHGMWHLLSATCFVIIADILYRAGQPRGDGADANPDLADIPDAAEDH